MAYIIQCGDSKCNSKTGTENIVDLKRNHCDEQGWFLCGHCGSRGYVHKKFELQEGGNPWEPYLKGIIQPRSYSDTAGYQPFAFLVSGSPEKEPDDIWFAYYKDFREQGGKLKVGYGPGGPPVFYITDMLDFVAQLVERGCLTADQVKKALE